MRVGSEEKRCILLLLRSVERGMRDAFDSQMLVPLSICILIVSSSEPEPRKNSSSNFPSVLINLLNSFPLNFSQLTIQYTISSLSRPSDHPLFLPSSIQLQFSPSSLLYHNTTSSLVPCMLCYAAWEREASVVARQDSALLSLSLNFEEVCVF